MSDMMSEDLNETHLTINKSNIKLCGKDLGITRTQLVVITMLSLYFFITWTDYALFAPFYPGSALKKGLNKTQIGLVFGVFQFSLLIFSPFFGKYVIFISFVVHHEFKIIKKI